MALFTKLGTLLRASAGDSLEMLTDANCLRIYRQEIRDAETMLQRRRSALAAMIASRKQLEQEAAGLQRKIAQRESQVQILDSTTLTEELLAATAREIAALELHEETVNLRLLHTQELVSEEELALRKLLGEINEHRRDLKILEAQAQRTGGAVHVSQSHTLHGRLVALREARQAVQKSIGTDYHLEAAEEEADQRINASPLESALELTRQDDTSLRAAAILERLRQKRNTHSGGER